MQAAPDAEPIRLARALMRGLDRAALSVALPGADAAPWPYGSLVLVAVDHDLSPILLVSTLAEHTKAMSADPRVALLFDGTSGLAQPLAGPRLSALGRAERSADPRLRARFLARHPDAETYARFGDFAIWRVAIERAHLVGGFGRIRWIDGALLGVDAGPSAALIGREADIVGHINADHADAIELCAARLLGRQGGGWRMTGIDRDGADLRRGGEVARLEFETPVFDADQARAALVAAVRRARAAG